MNFAEAKVMKFAIFILTAVAIVSWNNNCFAQRLITEGAASVGSGVSFGPGENAAVIMASPLYIDVDIIFANSERPKFEYVLGFQAEIIRRITAGVVPQIRLTNTHPKVLAYGILGIPVILAPFILFGPEIGGGLLWRISPKVGLFAEIVLDLFVIGTDLPKDSVLVQLDGNVGIRVKF